MFVCENDASSIKEVGGACGLKKQTMTSHLNELEKRGYIIRKTGENDRRELKVHLTPYGEKFKIALLEVISNLESGYLNTVGEVEMDRVMHTLENFHKRVKKEDIQQSFFS
jgi:DNA-binding MarR family transcriptional regulator